MISGAGTILGQGGGARPKAPKSASQKSVLRGKRIAFCSKNQRSLKKKNSPELESLIARKSSVF